MYALQGDLREVEKVACLVKPRRSPCSWVRTLFTVWDPERFQPASDQQLAGSDGHFQQLRCPLWFS